MKEVKKVQKKVLKLKAISQIQLIKESVLLSSQQVLEKSTKILVKLNFMQINVLKRQEKTLLFSKEY